MTNNPFDLLGVPPNSGFEDLQTAYQRRRAEAIAAQSPEETLRMIDQAYQNALEATARSTPAPSAPERSIQPVQAAPPALYTPPPQPPGFNPTSLASQAINQQAMPTGFGTITCPACGAQNPAQVSQCQQCGVQISRTCPVCTTQVPLFSAICPRCGAAVNEVSLNRANVANDNAQRIERERFVKDEDLRRHEERHTTRAIYGTVFYIMVAVGIVVLCGLAVLAFWFSTQPR